MIGNFDIGSSLSPLAWYIASSICQSKVILVLTVTCGVLVIQCHLLSPRQLSSMRSLHVAFDIILI